MASVDILVGPEDHGEVPAVSEVCVEGKAAPVVWGDAGAGKATGKTNIKCSFSA